MVVVVNAPAPALDLGVNNFSRAFAALGALSFCSLEPQFCQVESGRIKAVAPRAGAYGLSLAPASVGPAPVVTSSGHAGGKSSQAENRSLLCLTPITQASFAVGMIWNNDSPIATSQDVMAIDSFSTQGLRLVSTGYRLQVQRGSTIILQSDPIFNIAGPTMAIISRSGGSLRLLARQAGQPLQDLAATYDPAFTAALDVVYGAAEAAAPATARSLRDTMLDTWVFNRGILASVEDPARLLALDYYSEVYG